MMTPKHPLPQVPSIVSLTSLCFIFFEQLSLSEFTLCIHFVYYLHIV